MSGAREGASDHERNVRASQRGHDAFQQISKVAHGVVGGQTRWAQRSGAGEASLFRVGSTSIMTSWCLITDIDGTLVGGSGASLRLRDALRRERAASAAKGHRLYWAIATGRGLQSTREVLTEAGFALEDFDALVTSVGAELYLTGEPGANAEYHAHLASGGFEREAVLTALKSLDFLELQPESEQFEHKVSYFFEDTAERRARVHSALGALPFETQAVFAHREYLDITPKHGAKGGAVAHLLKLWQLTPQRAVAAGDSGNDESMLTELWHGIVVGNGRGPLAHLTNRRNLYFAEAPDAGGVLEGLTALGFITDPY
jgi:sucrose-6F-phosphate phosphohydrolase